jgi:signal peptidase II
VVRELRRGARRRPAARRQRSAASAWLAAGLGAALGGALGNLYDRVRHGAVLDFLHVGVGGVFNPADVGLVVGLVVALASGFGAATSLLARG